MATAEWAARGFAQFSTGRCACCARTPARDRHSPPGRTGRATQADADGTEDLATDDAVQVHGMRDADYPVFRVPYPPRSPPCKFLGRRTQSIFRGHRATVSHSDARYRHVQQERLSTEYITRRSSCQTALRGKQQTLSNCKAGISKCDHCFVGSGYLE